jgi:hypothetical protein
MLVHCKYDLGGGTLALRYRLRLDEEHVALVIALWALIGSKGNSTFSMQPRAVPETQGEPSVDIVRRSCRSKFLRKKKSWLPVTKFDGVD